MAYYPATPFVPQFFNDAGVPLSGGSITAYVAGTTTPTNMFIDDAGTSAGSVITLNARGEPAVSGNTVVIWLDDAVSYKFSLKDASGVSKWTIDDIGSTTSISEELAAGRVGRVVDSIAALKALDKTEVTRAYVTGYYAAGDGGGGHYWYDSADTTSADNGGTIIVASDGGRWKLSDVVTAATFGALGDGATDETAQLMNARDAVGLVQLLNGRTYAISSQIAATGDSQGFFCEGRASFKMLTGAGQFDRSSYAGSQFDPNACGVLCQSFDYYTMRGVAITMEATASVRTLKAFALRGSTGSTIDIEAFGFTESEDSVVALDSIVDCRVVANVHDCGTSDSTLPSMQISGVMIDDTRVNSIPTTNSYVHAYGKNIVLTGAALATYGAQTDGVTCAGTVNNHGLEILCQFENVGEAFDCFGSFVLATVHGKTCGSYGVKLIHGAQHCIVDAVIDGTAGAAVVLGGSNTATQDVAYNTVRCTASGVGTIASALVKTAVQSDGSSAAFLPRDNLVSVVIEANASMTHAVLLESGENNTVEYMTSGAQVPLQALIAASAGAGNKITRLNADQGGYVTGRYYGGGYLNLGSVTTLVLAANTLYAIPFRVQGLLLASLIGVHISAAAAGNARLGIYKWIDGAPSELVHDAGTISTGATGDIEVSINGGNGVTLTDGLYALAIVSDAAPTVYASAANFGTVNIVGVSSPGTLDHQLSRAFPYAALPTPFGAVAYSVGSMPNIWLRRS